MNPKGVRLQLDKYERYYPQIRSKKECALTQNGVWSPESVNRKYRYETGVCWKNEEHAKCAAHEVPQLLKPGNDKLPNRTELSANGAKVCNKNPSCRWTKFEQSEDCLSKVIAQKKEPLTSPPAEMPSNVTKGNIELFLDNMYNKRQVHKSDGSYETIEPPKITSLEGTGDRCNPKPANAKTEPSKKNSINDNVDPFNSPKPVKIRHPDENEAIVSSFDDPQGTEMTPSVVQSVINMIMKGFAIKEKNGQEISNRGILAWHSTGSGKTCLAAGVMDAFWNSGRDIIFASSIEALKSNESVKFMECLVNLYPDFKRFKRATKEESIAAVDQFYNSRGIRRFTFAVLANKLEKTERSKILKRGGHVASGNKRKLTHKTAQNIKQTLNTSKTIPKNTKSKTNTLKSQTSISSIESKSSKIDKKQKIPALKVKTRQVERAIPKIDKHEIIDLNNTVLIIDEVHNLFRPLANQKERHNFLKSRLIDPTKYPGLKIVILSATPGDNIEDVMTLLNMIRDPTHPVIKPPTNDPVSITEFKSAIRGLVSYLNMSGDSTKFPITKDLEHIMAPMGDNQFKQYVEKYNEIENKDSATNYAQLAKKNQLAKYWELARKYSNMPFKFDKKAALAEIGSKLPMLFKNIAQYPLEKHYVYSAFNMNKDAGWNSQGILTIARLLERDLGYKPLDLTKDVKFALHKNPDGTEELRLVQMPSKAKRYILVTTKEVGEPGASSKAGDKLAKLLAIYNHPDNRYGELVHVMLASNSFNEGLDLKAVRHIHFFEPLVTMASDKQTIGRAARFCSHAALDRSKGEWSVSIHRYMSTQPVNIELNSSSRKNNSTAIRQPSTGPTNAEKERIAVLDADISSMKASIEQVKKELEQYKRPGKDEAKKKKKEDLSTSLKEKTEQVKTFEKQLKELNSIIEKRDKDITKASKALKKAKHDLSSIKMIDEFIFNESREHMDVLSTIFQSMKEAALDCRLLDKFHANIGEKVKCEPYESMPRDFKAKNTKALNAHKSIPNKLFFSS